jgi:hypothetical protein
VAVAAGRNTAGDIRGIGTQDLDELFFPVVKVIETAKPQNRRICIEMINALRSELAKGSGANDSIMAEAIDKLIARLPSSKEAIMNFFDQPIIAANAGPVTKFVLGKMRQNQQL